MMKCRSSIGLRVVNTSEEVCLAFSTWGRREHDRASTVDLVAGSVSFDLGKKGMGPACQGVGSYIHGYAPNGRNEFVVLFLSATHMAGGEN
jgi:hypothetical protein